jgi:hypothetical protein
MRKTTKAISFVSATCFIGGAAILFSHEAHAQSTQLPSPDSLIKMLDLACHKATAADPPVRSLRIKHLNPVLTAMGFGEEQIDLGTLEQLCVPVQKDRQVPPPDVLPFIQYIDLACYQAKSPIVRQTSINLDQLNPVTQRMGLPPHRVVIRDLRQMCVPVQKRGTEIPADVLKLVQHVDVACYNIDVPTNLPQLPLTLTDLNPLFNASVQDVRTLKPEQLCVPVAKSVDIPREIQKIISVIDFEKFAVSAPSVVVPRTLTVRHLNPQFANALPFKFDMLNLTHLDLPVAKKPLAVQP